MATNSSYRPGHSHGRPPDPSRSKSRDWDREYSSFDRRRNRPHLDNQRSSDHQDSGRSETYGYGADRRSSRDDNEDRHYRDFSYHDQRSANSHYSRTNEDQVRRRSSRDDSDHYRHASPQRRSSLDYDRERSYRERDYGSHRRYGYDEERDHRNREYEPRYRSRSRSPRRHQAPQDNPPSREMKLTGIPYEMDNDGLRNELSQDYGVNNLVDVRIIRNRNTNQSSGYAFITFSDLQSSTEFMDKFHSSLELGRNCPSGMRLIKLLFVVERGSRNKPSSNRTQQGRATFQEPDKTDWWYCGYTKNWNPPYLTNCQMCGVIRPVAGAVPFEQSIFNPSRGAESPDNHPAADSEPIAAEEGSNDQPKTKLKIKKLKPKAAEPQTQTAANIARWQQIQATARAEEENQPETPVNDEATDGGWVHIMSYADAHPKHLICLLCCAKFTTVEELRKHEELSKLHVKNLRDPVKIAFATMCLRNIGKAPKMVKVLSARVRDRARERRLEERAEQAARPKVRLTLKKKDDEQKETPAPLSKGAALLAKAAGDKGWAAGQGLGAHGEGITAPIEARGYQSGVGLGAVGESTEGLSQREIGLQKASERYSKLG